MAKIQVTTADIQAKAEVIVLNSYFIANVVRAHDCIDTIIEQNKHAMQEYNEGAKKWEPKVDENGNQVFEYQDYTTQVIEERVYPFLKELLKSLGIEQPVV
jgi:hypothetical protein